MFCASCGKEVSEGSTFCVTCGKSLGYLASGWNNTTPQEIQKNKWLADFIIECWQGARPLGQVFWIYYLLVPLCILFLIGMFIDVVPQSAKLWLFGPLVAFIPIQQIWAVVAVWRCAKNSPRWGTLARVWIVFVIVSFPIRVALNIPHYTNYIAESKHMSYFDSLSEQAHVKLWNDVRNGQEFRNLSSSEKMAAKEQYWDDVLKPRIAQDQISEEKEHFFNMP